MGSEGKCFSICLKKQAIIVKASRSTSRVVILGAIWSFGSRTEVCYWQLVKFTSYSDCVELFKHLCIYM